MSVGLVDVGMIVEVLLDMNNIVTLSAQRSSNESRVCRLISWNFVVVEECRQTGNVVSEDVELSRVLGNSEAW